MNVIEQFEQNCVACDFCVGSHLIVQVREKKLALLFIVLGVEIDNGHGRTIVFAAT